MARYLIRTFSNAGDVVLDSTSGADSFLVPALLKGRNFIGIEKNENVTDFKVNKADYIEITKQRIEETKEYLDQNSPEHFKQQKSQLTALKYSNTL